MALMKDRRRIRDCMIDGRIATGTIAENFVLGAFEDAARKRIRTFNLGTARFELELSPQVFPCMPLSLAMAMSLPDLSGLTVLDVGTGTGILAIAAALRRAAKVGATDINSLAVSMANRNFQRNELSEVCSACKADMFPSAPKRFDVVLSNPPNMRVSARVLPKMEKEMIMAVDGGPRGCEFTLRLLRESRHLLSPGGSLIVPFPHWCDLVPIEACTRDQGYFSRQIGECVIPDWIPTVWAEGARKRDARTQGNTVVRIFQLTKG